MHRLGPRGAKTRLRAAVLALTSLCATAGTLGALLTSCTPTEGYVEIAWALIDQGGASLYPDGSLTNTCDFVGLVARGGDAQADPVETPATLRFELLVCDPECSGGCDDPECQVIDPRSFACNTARGSVTVPSSELDHRFEARVIAELDGDPACACTLSTECVQLPGPRDRKVRGGLVTDLQVYQIVLDLDDPTTASIDLRTCCELPESCS